MYNWYSDNWGWYYFFCYLFISLSGTIQCVTDKEHIYKCLTQIASDGRHWSINTNTSHLMHILTFLAFTIKSVIILNTDIINLSIIHHHSSIHEQIMSSLILFYWGKGINYLILRLQ